MTNCFLIKWRRNRIYTTGTKIIRMGNVCQEDGRAPGASQGAKGMFLRRHRWWWVLQPSSRTSIVSREDLPNQSSSSSFFNIKSHLIRAAQDNGWWSPIKMCTSKKSFTWTRAKRQTLPLLILMDMTKTWSRRLFLLLHKMAGSLKSANRVNTKHYVHNRICMNGIRRMGFLSSSPSIERHSPLTMYVFKLPHMTRLLRLIIMMSTGNETWIPPDC